MASLAPISEAAAWPDRQHCFLYLAWETSEGLAVSADSSGRLQLAR